MVSIDLRERSGVCCLFYSAELKESEGMSEGRERLAEFIVSKDCETFDNVNYAQRRLLQPFW